MNWESYISKISEEFERGKRIYIYGAGRMGRRLHQELNQKGIMVDGFLVSDASVNKKTECGIPVREISESFSCENVFILIAVKSPWNKDIKNKLEQNGYSYLDKIDEIEHFLTKPILFEINACVGCSVACKYCPQGVLLKRYTGERNMTFSTFKTAVDKIPLNIKIGFSGFSEPFQNPDMTDMIRYAYESGHDVMLCTTLVGLTMGKFNLIRDIPFYRVTLHLPDDEGNANIPMTNEYFKVLDEVLEWKTVRDGISINMVEKANCQGRVHPKVKEFVDGRVLIFSELADRAGNLKDSFLHSVNTLKGKIYCNYSPDLNNNVLMPNGDVVLCCMDFGLRHILGNMLRDSFADIRNSKELLKIKSALSGGADVLCRHCTEAKLCKG